MHASAALISEVCPQAEQLTLMNLLTERGAVVRVYDPIAMGNMRRLHPDAPVAFAESEADLAQGCDAVVVVTDWPQFQHQDLEEIRDAMRGDLIVDARNMLHRSDVEQLSLRYIGIGRQAAGREQDLRRSVAAAQIHACCHDAP